MNIVMTLGIAQKKNEKLADTLQAKLKEGDEIEVLVDGHRFYCIVIGSHTQRQACGTFAHVFSLENE